MADDIQIPLLHSNTSSTLKSELGLSDLRPQQPLNLNLRVGIIGTGPYALALVKRLTSLAGCDVIIGSRKPEVRRRTLTALGGCFCGVALGTIRECVSGSDIVIVAIHRENFQSTLADVSHLLSGKVVVDVSNRDTRHVTRSNAEFLASILPGASVVKAFNSISAVAMEELAETGSSSNAAVYVAANDPEAREKVITLAQAMGFRAVNLGLLTSARWMEEDLLSVFPLWRLPVALAVGIFLVAWVYIVYIYFMEREKAAFSWEQLFVKVSNKPVCMTAITMIALTYLPGQLASVVQIWNGTKHRRFPQFLDTWLKCRKQMGLVAFFLVTLHVIMSVLMLSPTYYSSWFHKPTVTLPANATLTSDLVLDLSKQWMTWKGEAACLLGVLAFVLMSVVALTSIRSVGDSLNWSEWRCVQSNLGYVVLAVSVAHVTVMGAQGWQKRGFPLVFKSITFLSALLPYLVLALKIAFSLPPLSGYLRRIRRGWERETARYGLHDSRTKRSCCKPSGNNGVLGPEPGASVKGVTNFYGDGLDSEKSGDGARAGGAGDEQKVQSILVQVEADLQDSQYRAVSLHKDCACAEHNSAQATLPQCQCSSF